MILATIRPDEPSRSPERPCYYDASATIDGRTYTARARYGVVGALARLLVAAGVADAPLLVRQPGAAEMTYRSFHAVAGRTIREGPAHPIHGAPWVDLAEAFGRPAPVPYTAQNRGYLPADDISAIPTLEPAISAPTG